MYENSPHRSPSTQTRITLLAALAVLALLPVAAAVPDSGQAAADEAKASTDPAAAPIRFEMRLVSDVAQEGWLERTVALTSETVYLSPEAALDTGHLARAWPDAQGGENVVGLYLTEEGALALARLTTSHVGERIAIVLDGKVVSIPRVMAAITGGRALINGKFSQDEVREIAARLTAAIAARSDE